MGKRCRVWWPNQLSISTAGPNFLLGWFVSSSSSSLDAVIAFACTEPTFSDLKTTLQGIVDDTNGKMPVLLQDRSKLCLLGQFASEEQSSSCGCRKLSGSLERCRQSFVESSCYWIQMLSDHHEQFGKEVTWIPKLHHIHWNGEIVPRCDVHLIIYEIPTYGAHHFSLDLWNSLDQTKAPLRKPKWVDELHQKQQLLDLDTVILAINSVSAAHRNFRRSLGAQKSFVHFSIIYMILGFTWQLFSALVASLSTIFYVILQFLHMLLTYASDTWTYIILVKVFRSARINMRIRFSQILYWPIFLRDNGMRSQSSVEYAEKAALLKHSMWSSLAVDVFLGNLIGLALLYHAEFACIRIVRFAIDITNELLRSGCVWLMGVPAGFKLNTELAEVLGMISLTTIQIWSTIWIFLGFHFLYVIRGLAISGIIFGLTIPAALIIDLIALVTIHVSTLHRLISLLYSTQIQALAGLWRLFSVKNTRSVIGACFSKRSPKDDHLMAIGIELFAYILLDFKPAYGGRKWNPLRQRLDSYDYTVKQHIVGSLLFTPLLLLLPTTSVFYIFFTIMNTTISLICILIEVSISVIHATPFIKVLLWLVKPRRFPSGIWFEVKSVSCQGIDSEITSMQNEQDRSKEKSSVVVSILHSNFLSVGQIILPHYSKVLSGKPQTLLATAAYGVLIGRRIPSTIGTDLPTFSWMLIPYKDYWHLCYDSILECYRT